MCEQVTRELGVWLSGRVYWIQHGTRGGAYYTLSDRVLDKNQQLVPLFEPDYRKKKKKYSDYVKTHGFITNSLCRQLLKINVNAYINENSTEFYRGCPELNKDITNQHIYNKQIKIDDRKAFYFQWHFIENCNLRCIHCYQEGYDFKDLDKDKVFQIAKSMDQVLSKWGKIGRISLTGGEPFIRQDLLEELLNFFNQSNNIYWLGILTNGTLIDNDIVLRLKKFEKLKEIQVSIDGSDDKNHDLVRGKGSFIKAINGIKKIKDSGLGVSIMFTIHNMNKGEAINVINLANDLGVEAITIERITPMTKKDINDLYIKPDELKKIYSQIYKKKQELEQHSELKIRVSRPLWTLVDNNLGGFCPVGLTSLCIMHDGTVLPCRRLDIPLGNVLQEGLFKIWYTSELLWKLRNKNLLDVKCRSCAMLPNCGGCRAIAYHVNGDFLASDPQCWK
ncbi:MAG: radical SAM protein [Desulfotomaculaceae bacterium]